jgi:hypothetical protein
VDLDWKRPVWTVDVSGHPAVLHRHARHRDHADLVWPSTASRPSSPPTKRSGRCRTGAFLARFHQSTRALDLGRRPTQPPPARSVVAELPWDEIERRIGAARSDWFRSLGERLTSRPIEAGVFDRPTGPVHGDVTVFNVLVDDDVQVVDLAYAGWSWSRTSFVAEELDTGRLQQLVRGYHRIEPMPDPGGRAGLVGDLGWLRSGRPGPPGPWSPPFASGCAPRPAPRWPGPAPGSCSRPAATRARSTSTWVG